MKKVTLISALCGLLGFGAASSQATPYWDHDIIGTTLGAGDAPITGTFDIAVGDGDAWDYAGYDSSTDSLLAAFATFTLLDFNLRETKVEIDLGSQAFAQVSGLILPVFVSGGILGQALLDLDATGSLTYTIENTGRTPFTVLTASLNATSVPDGASTIGLLGIGLVITALVGRRSRLRRNA